MNLPHPLPSIPRAAERSARKAHSLLACFLAIVADWDVVPSVLSGNESACPTLQATTHRCAQPPANYIFS